MLGTLCSVKIVKQCGGLEHRTPLHHTWHHSHHTFSKGALQPTPGLWHIKTLRALVLRELKIYTRGYGRLCKSGLKCSQTICLQTSGKTSKNWNKCPSNVEMICCIILLPQLMMHADADNIIILYYCHPCSSFISHTMQTTCTTFANLIDTAAVCIQGSNFHSARLLQSEHSSLSPRGKSPRENFQCHCNLQVGCNAP